MTGRLLTLKEACVQLAGGHITPATLRAEAAKGRLDMVRLGRRDFVTVEALDALIESCRVVKPHQGSTWTPRAGRGSSETDRPSVALASLNETVTLLRKNLRRT